MDAAYIHHLKQPCKNRGVIHGGPSGDGVLLDDKQFDTMTEAEDYLESKPRKDIGAF